VGIPVVDVHVRFLLPWLYAETLEVESAVTESGRNSFTVNHRFQRGQGLAAEIAENRVWSAQAASGSGGLESKAAQAALKEKFGAPAEPATIKK